MHAASLTQFNPAIFSINNAEQTLIKKHAFLPCVVKEKILNILSLRERALKKERMAQSQTSVLGLMS